MDYDDDDVWWERGKGHWAFLKDPCSQIPLRIHFTHDDRLIFKHETVLPKNLKYILIGGILILMTTASSQQ